MLAIQKVLMPTDFSDCALQALGHAVSWARRHRAELTVLHVLDEDSDDASESEVRVGIRKLLAAHGGTVRSAWAVVRAPSARTGILAYARDHSMDLIVMGTHGRTPFGALLLGSVAQDVMRCAPCPVLAVRQSARPAIPGRLERIVVPVNFTPRSRHDIRLARELAALDTATLILLHVAQGNGEEPGPPEDAGRLRTEPLDRLYGASSGPDVRVEMHVLRGRAGAEIAAFAARNHASLLVMAPHGVAGGARRILGGITEETLSSASCPVLVLPPVGRRFVVEASPPTATTHAWDDCC
jgi:nucleotide-binding universal stress UspA family protein